MAPSSVSAAGSITRWPNVALRFSPTRWEAVVADRFLDFRNEFLTGFNFGNERIALLRHIGGDFFGQVGGQIRNGGFFAALDKFAVNAACFRADDFGYNEQFIAGLEHAPGDKHLRAGELADLGRGIRADSAGQAGVHVRREPCRAQRVPP